MSQVPNLLPCPFCGYKASMTNVESAASGRYMWIVGCDSEDCDVSFHGHARQIDAGNITARDIVAGNIDAGNIDYYAACLAYDSFRCRSVKGRRDNALHACLDQEIEYVAEKKGENNEKNN